MCNCLVWAVYMRLFHGGKIRWHKSRTWFGFHTTWISNLGNEWEYTLAKPKRQPWWYVPLCYRGRVKELL